MTFRGPLPWFSLNFAGVLILLLAMGIPAAGAAEVAGTVGGIMLGVACAGFLGMPMKGNANPLDVAAGAAGVLSVAALAWIAALLGG